MRRNGGTKNPPQTKMCNGCDAESNGYVAWRRKMSPAHFLAPPPIIPPQTLMDSTKTALRLRLSAIRTR